ncbi:hypothetical protein HGRIS_001466 [Hohenbuehelia grisea]|uniref:Uncharacterized protein n=1 Tax=Hohenbuehelia grisea TaxID=104357 RepID=A0ABR3JR89_9AGAR
MLACSRAGSDIAGESDSFVISLRSTAAKLNTFAGTTLRGLKDNMASATATNMEMLDLIQDITMYILNTSVNLASLLKAYREAVRIMLPDGSVNARRHLRTTTPPVTPTNAELNERYDDHWLEDTLVETVTEE